MRLVTKVVLGAVLAIAAACQHPIATRTWVFAVPGHGGWDHPAKVPARAVELALEGRVPAAELPAVAAAASRAFAHLRRDQVVYYRHPDGGAWLLGVRGGKLVVVPYGLRASAGRAAEYPLEDLAAAGAGPPKQAVVGESGENGKDVAELEVECAFAVPQYLFLNGTFLGVVAPGETHVFTVPAGKAEITAADDEHGRAPVRASFEFRAGRIERWSIQPKF